MYGHLPKMKQREIISILILLIYNNKKSIYSKTLKVRKLRKAHATSGYTIYKTETKFRCSKIYIQI